MKKTLLACFVLFLVALAGIGGWFLRTTSETRAASNQFMVWAQSQKVVPVDFSVAVPDDTPPHQTLYLSGNSVALGDWDAAGIPLQRGADGRYHATVQLLTGIDHLFKVTRGTWGTVERGPAGAEIADHSFVAEPGKTVEVTVASWVDNGQSVPGVVTLTGTFRFHKKFPSKLLGNDRTIIVYLPPNYDFDAKRRYPVLYMQDGQNLFDSSTSFAGVEWQVDENAQSLILSQKIQPVIIVGIYNTPQRTQEFTPFSSAPDGSPAQGRLYGQFIVDELKPFIDQTYRTRPDRAHTALAGSSMGGLITLAIVHDHPGIFGSIAVLDPWLRDSAHSLFDAWTNDAWMKNTRFYVDMGTAGGPQYPTNTEVADAKQLVQRFDAAGLKPGTGYSFHVIDGAPHSESAWQKRVAAFLTFLYGQRH